MGATTEFRLPDIGDFQDVEVIELLVSEGDRVRPEDSLVVLESDKATMEIPSPWAGVVRKILVAVGDKVSENSPIALIEVEDEVAAAPAEPRVPAAQKTETPEISVETPAPPVAPATPTEGAAPTAHASPSVRRLSRELGVDLTLVAATGRKGRVLQEDVQGYVKGMLAKGTAAGVPIAGVSVMRPPDIDFEKYGETELQPLHKVRKLSAANLHRSWVTVPHVTQFDEADVTALEEFRRGQKAAAEARNVKLTFLPFLLQAAGRLLKEFPHFNSSLDRTGENLVLKKYVNVGVAVDTPHGLVVPVVKDADQKGLFAIAAELMDLSARARDRKLRPEHLQGGTFSISSLGGIGGTFFTPIVNHPEVAILGVSRMEWRPVYRGDALEKRLILPISLSYDHRVIDGADAVRFTTRLAQVLSDLRLLLL